MPLHNHILDKDTHNLLVRVGRIIRKVQGRCPFCAANNYLKQPLSHWLGSKFLDIGLILKIGDLWEINLVYRSIAKGHTSRNLLVWSQKMKFASFTIPEVLVLLYLRF